MFNLEIMYYSQHIHIGQFPEDGNFGQNVAPLLKAEPSCDQTKGKGSKKKKIDLICQLLCSNCVFGTLTKYIGHYLNFDNFPFLAPQDA